MIMLSSLGNHNRQSHNQEERAPDSAWPCPLAKLHGNPEESIGSLD